MRSSSEVREAATLAERERIIKLLETNTPFSHGLTTRLMNWVVAVNFDPSVQDCADFTKEIIDLIKRETK